MDITKIFSKKDIDHFYKVLLEETILKDFPIFNKEYTIHLQREEDFEKVIDKSLDKLTKHSQDLNGEIYRLKKESNYDLAKRRADKLDKVNQAVAILDIIKNGSGILGSETTKEVGFINNIGLSKNSKENLRYVSGQSIISSLTEQVLSLINDFEKDSYRVSGIFSFISIAIIAYKLKDNKKFDFINKTLSKFEFGGGAKEYIEETEDFEEAFDDDINNGDILLNLYDFKSKKINKALGDILSQFGIANKFEKKDIEYTGEVLLQTIEEFYAEVSESIKEVRGDLINYFYLKNNYDLVRKNGSIAEESVLARSCMRHVNKNVDINFYSENRDSVSMIVKTDVNNKVRARAILWKALDGNKYIDRIYSATEKDNREIISYAKKKGYENLYTGSSLPITEKQIAVIVKDIDRRPYLDSMGNVFDFKYNKNDNNVYSILTNKNNRNGLNIENLLNEIDIVDPKNYFDRFFKSKYLEDKGIEIQEIFDSYDVKKYYINDSDNKDKNSVYATITNYIDSKGLFENYCFRKFKMFTDKKFTKSENPLPDTLFFDPINNKIPKNISDKVLIDFNNKSNLNDNLINNIILYKYINKKEIDSNLFYFVMEKRDIAEDTNIVFSSLYKCYIYTPSFVKYNDQYTTRDDYEDFKIQNSEEFAYLINLAKKYNKLYINKPIEDLIKEKIAYLKYEKIYSINIGDVRYVETIEEYIENSEESKLMLKNANDIARKGLNIKNLKREGKYIKFKMNISEDTDHYNLYLDIFKIVNEDLITVSTGNKLKDKFTKVV